MENQNEFQERHGVPSNEERDNAGNNIFADAGAADEDLGTVKQTVRVLPDLEEGEDNRFMDDEEEIGDPLESVETVEEPEEFEEISEEDEDFEELDEDEEEEEL